MGQQHVQSYFAAALILSSEFRHNGNDMNFQIQQTALVKNHVDGSSGYDLRNRSQIKDAGAGHFRRLRIICKAANGLQCDQFSLTCYRDRGSGESVLCNGLLQYLKGRREDRVLLLVSWSRKMRGSPGCGIQGGGTL